MVKQITSLQNPLIRNLLLLQEKPRERRLQDLVIIEGARETALASASDFSFRTILFCPDLIDEKEIGNLIPVHDEGPEMIEIPREVFNRLAYRKDSGGIIAVATPVRRSFNDLHLSANPLILVLETVEKPGNLGALLRTADAGNLDAVVICEPQTDIYNPNAIRSSVGCIFTMPVVTSTTEETITWLKSKNIKSFATALTATHLYHETDFRQPSAIIMGSEANGLSRQWLDGADDQVKIPMRGKIDSMNVSASAAIVIFEALRQRGFPG
jgi:RNA methyltransferase, TrmH family